MNIKNQIIDLIDDINVTESDVRYDTMCKMYESYDKASMIIEYYDGDNIDAFNIFNDTDNFYQESSISDKMKDSGKKYGTLMKILTFIPRLIKALIQTISEKLKKTKPAKELQNASKETKKALADAFDKKKDKKKRVAIVTSLILGAGAAGIATKVGVDKSRKRFIDNEIRKFDELIVQITEEVKDKFEGNTADADSDHIVTELENKLQKVIDFADIIVNHNAKFKERKAAIRSCHGLLDEMKKDVMEIKPIPKEKKNKVSEKINDADEFLASLSNAEDENELNELMNSFPNNPDKSSTSTKQNKPKGTPTSNPEVEKKAEKIVDEIDKTIDILKKKADEINKKIKDLGLPINKNEVDKYDSVYVRRNDYLGKPEHMYFMILDEAKLSIVCQTIVFNTCRMIKDAISGRDIDYFKENVNKYEEEENEYISNNHFYSYKHDILTDDFGFRENSLKDFNKYIDKYEETIANFNSASSDIPEDIQGELMQVIRERNKLVEKWRTALILSIDFQNTCITEINKLIGQLNVKDDRKGITIDTSKFKTINNDIRISEKK